MREFTKPQRVSELLQQRCKTWKWLVDETGIGDRIIKAIFYQRYTPSPVQRVRVANALNTDCDQIMWGHIAHVDGLKEPI